MLQKETGRQAFALRTFGGSALIGPDGAAVAGLGAKAMGLLALLASNRSGPLTRDALVEMLWERVTPSQGRGSLRQELRRLKKALGEEGFERLFEVTDSRIGLRRGQLEFDGAELEEAAGSDDPERLARILDVYGGEFLVDNAARAEPFQDWARERRAYYEGLALTALTRLAEADLAAGRFERCLRAADMVIRVDPLQEGAQSAMIRAHAAGGRRAQARAAFERYRARLLRELGEEPSSDLAALIAGGAEAPARPAPRPPRTRDERPVVAVLDTSRPQSDEHAYLAAGMVEELVANLARSNWIRVSSLDAPFLPRASEIDISQRDLREAADYLLRVNVQLSREDAAIVATLSRLSDHASLFSETLHAAPKDLLRLQRDTAIRIAAIFEEKMIDDQGEQVRDVDFAIPSDLDHWRTLMRARWLFWKSSRRANAEAQRLLREATRMKPEDSPTWCLLAFSRMLDGWTNWAEDPRAAFAEARGFAQRAVREAPNSAWAQFTLGAACSTAETLPEAKARVEHAINLSPTFVSAIGELARLHAFMGDADAAMRLADEAMALSPYDPHYGLFVRTKAIAEYLGNRLDKALSLVDYAIIIRPGWFMNHFLKAAILAEMDRVEEARRAFSDGAAMIGPYSDAALALGHPFADPAQLRRFAAALNRAGGNFFRS